MTTEGFVTVAVMTRRMARAAKAAQNRPFEDIEVEPAEPARSSTDPDELVPELEVEQSPPFGEGGQSWEQALEESD